jgi:GNAT superfamily N-acetyltransferase
MSPSMRASIELRAANLDDAPAVARLHADSWRAAYRGILRDEFLDGDVFANRLALWQQRLSAPARHQAVFLAVDDGRPVGFSCVFGRSDPQWGSLLDNLHVAPPAQGTGIGKRLLHEACVWLHQCLPDEERLFLWVYGANAPARRFYEKLGGRAQECTLADAPDGEVVPSVRYAWHDIGQLCRVTQP